MTVFLLVVIFIGVFMIFLLSFPSLPVYKTDKDAREAEIARAEAQERRAHARVFMYKKRYRHRKKADRPDRKGDARDLAILFHI